MYLSDRVLTQQAQSSRFHLQGGFSKVVGFTLTVIELHFFKKLRKAKYNEVIEANR